MGCGASAKYEAEVEEQSEGKDWAETPQIGGLKRGSVILRRGESGDLRSYYNFQSEASNGGAAKSIGSVKKATSLASQEDRSCRRIKKASRTAESIDAEVDLLRQMDHPQIAHVYETFEDATYHTIITDFCSLGSLAEAIVSRAKLTEPEGACVMNQLVRAVLYLHEVKVCHRGLRPEVIMLHQGEGSDGLDHCTAKVMDLSHAVHFKRGHSIRGKVDTIAYSAPELHDGKCTEVCDAWSCGAILYTMLDGAPPFGGQVVEATLGPEEEVEIKRRAATVSFVSDGLQQMSKKARKVVKGLLQWPEEARMLMKQILGCEWFYAQGLEAFVHVPLSVRHLENMNEFSCANPLKKLALNIIAQRLPESEVKDLRAIFDSMDLDKNGIVTYKELKMALEDMDQDKMTWRQKTAHPVDPKALMNLLDTNGSLQLDFTEFVAATINKQQYSNENLLLAAFKAIDADGSGEIDIHELTEVLLEDKASTPKLAEWIKEVLDEADADGSGQIDFEEFKSLVMRVSLSNRKGDAPTRVSMQQSSKEGQNGRCASKSTNGSSSRPISASSRRSS